MNSICLLFLDKALAGPQQCAILKSNSELFSHFLSVVPFINKLLRMNLPWSSTQEPSSHSFLTGNELWLPLLASLLIVWIGTLFLLCRTAVNMPSFAWLEVVRSVSAPRNLIWEVFESIVVDDWLCSFENECLRVESLEAGCSLDFSLLISWKSSSSQMIYQIFGNIWPSDEGRVSSARSTLHSLGLKTQGRSQKKVKVLLARKKQSRSPTTQGSVRPRLGAADGPTKHLTIGSLPYKDMQILFHPIRYIRQRSSLDNNSPADSRKSWILGRSDTSVPHTS